MQAENENLSAQQSLEIITGMIRQAKGNLSSNRFYFLLWGWTIAIANLGVFIMMRFTDISNPPIIFSITIVSAIVSIVYGATQSKGATSRTILDNVNMWMWIGYGVTSFTIVAFGNKVGWQINSILITMGSVPTFVTGIMLRFRPLVFGGAVLWVFGIALFLIPGDLHFLLSAIAITLGYLLPGYMLKKQA